MNPHTYGHHGAVIQTVKLPSGIVLHDDDALVVIRMIKQLEAAKAKRPKVYEEPAAIVSRTPNVVSVAWIGDTEWPNNTKLYAVLPEQA